MREIGIHVIITVFPLNIMPGLELQKITMVICLGSSAKGQKTKGDETWEED